MFFFIISLNWQSSFLDLMPKESTSGETQNNTVANRFSTTSEYSTDFFRYYYFMKTRANVKFSKERNICNQI